ncbi:MULTISPECIES: sensor histidine kinase [unclassified Bacillus (in: firmicutes)]|uniref:sensor histidine kinase n=1 Tax=unclassified Bacillus (in: firmicutes) TaxID=185979 RepID=UPI0008E69596|nr:MULTISPECIES: sensor histidine kinase [unclassified Bacillus (in: firmicutes)]SFA86660.1 two-component system, NarL family, sensor histidine kinase DesK [Bacillus sp. UNCCL13]SFQ83795.1 two-component system, NarL family, sensor histidine kinase DesK [Bacillus sp. cl95]
MFRSYWIHLKSTGISPYIWTILVMLPFYFIFQQSATTIEIFVGIFLTLIFFLIYWLAFVSKGWTVYLWTCILIGISIATTIQFSYVYFAFFLAYLIGNVKDRVAFLTLYFIHLFGTSAAINLNIVWKEELFLRQLPMVVVIWISIILLPFSIRHKTERGQLQEKLEDANKRISELVKLEERQRIARDLHDTLGQKLSLIGLKSDLARKLIHKDPERARDELYDVQQTARTALNEVRKMVAHMRGIRLVEELVHVKQILKAAQIELVTEPDFNLTNVSLLTENILSMCLKEAVTNIVKHSGATECSIYYDQSDSESVLTVKDNGNKAVAGIDFNKGSGLLGMKERLEFVNGSLEILVKDGTMLVIKVPNVVRLSDRGGA